MAFESYMYMYDSRAMAESFRYHPTILFFFYKYYPKENSHYQIRQPMNGENVHAW